MQTNKIVNNGVTKTYLFFGEGHKQHPQEVNVWAGILDNGIIGALFLTIAPLITIKVEIEIGTEGNLFFFTFSAGWCSFPLDSRQTRDSRID